MAQPQLTADDIPAAGDKKVDYVADTTGVEPGPAGANVSWDFSTLTRVSSRDSVITETVAASGTPHASDFPSANLAARSVSGTSWAYYSTTTTQASLVGVAATSGSTTVKQKYTDPQIVLKVPLMYNGTTTDNFEASYVANGITIYRSGTVTTTADAYGTIIMPHRTFSNVLRIKNVTFIKDSFDVFGEWFVSITESESYTYHSPGRLAAILNILYTSSTQDGIPAGSSKSVFYNDIEPLAGVDELLFTGGEFSVYPNPASGRAAIRLQAKNAVDIQIEICSATGQRIHRHTARVQPGENNIPLSVNALSRGLYFVHITDGTGVSVQKLVVE